METNLREPTTVGEMLTEEFLKDLNMSQEHFGKQLGLSRKVINQICLNKRRITVEEAVDMAILLNTDADFWIRVQANHDEWLARQQENERRAKGLRPLFVAHML
ncbi:addiction module antidote protein, HigA family [Salmonella enterica]|uniref:HigA family addiction module antitoxin n=1 Tax=Erwinia amylovora TaxID=552 RepID=UPI001DFAD7F2|nr:HigA family addiction module antitoxin [Erwinia amylovora]EAQ0916001.1 addiction module antidote protein, HigA family [Salmonella enterica]ELA5548125.1 HigA family addiction module antidote protein [Salmonella enterica]ELE3839894.1 HigA family addiction module antidote protein [Salmonella enterica]MCK8410904.1 HigA family addiction module antitoxin [Erwinia amylovora]